jgi:hypothetical protein
MSYSVIVTEDAMAPLNPSTASVYAAISADLRMAISAAIAGRDAEAPETKNANNARTQTSGTLRRAFDGSVKIR